MQCNPSRWVWGLIPIAMLSWATFYRERPHVEADLSERAQAALHAAGHSWAKVTLDGREAVITGRAAKDGQPKAALDIVRSVWGIRTVQLKTDLAGRQAVPAAVGPAADPEFQRAADRKRKQEEAAAAAALKARQEEAAKVLKAKQEAEAAARKAREEARRRAEIEAQALADRRAKEAAAAQAGREADALAAARSKDEADREAQVRADAEARRRAQEEAEAARRAYAEEMAGIERARRAREAAEAQTSREDAVAREAAERATAERLAAEAKRAEELRAQQDAADKAKLAAAEAAAKAKADTDADAEARRRVARLADEAEQARKDRKTTEETRACEQRLADASAKGVILFKRAKADIDPKSSLTIARIAEIIKACPGARVEVEGHTDGEGEPERNQRLSERRARAVLRSLMHAGVPEDRLSAVGYGAERPVAPNDTADGMARNRRIEFRAYTE